MNEYNSFGNFGCIVKNPTYVIEFKNDKWGYLGPLTFDTLYTGIFYMNFVTLSKIDKKHNEWKNERVIVKRDNKIVFDEILEKLKGLTA